MPVSPALLSSLCWLLHRCIDMMRCRARTHARMHRTAPHCTHALTYTCANDADMHRMARRGMASIPCQGTRCHALCVPCHAMPCHAMPCHAMPCHAMPCHAMPCHAMPCHAMPCHPSDRTNEVYRDLLSGTYFRKKHDALYACAVSPRSCMRRTHACMHARDVNNIRT